MTNIAYQLPADAPCKYVWFLTCDVCKKPDPTPRAKQLDVTQIRALGWGSRMIGTVLDECPDCIRAEYELERRVLDVGAKALDDAFAKFRRENPVMQEPA